MPSVRRARGRLRRFSYQQSSLAARRPIFEDLEGRWLLSAAAPVDPTALTSSATTPGGTSNQAAGEAAIGDSIDAFGLDLYAQLQSETGGNLFVSPFSIATALAMTYAGARGETAQQMASVLHFGSDAATVESEFGALLSDLNGAGQTGGYLLSAANALWAQQGLNILPEFLNVVQSDFNGGLQQADFINDAEAARQTINNWVAQQTNGKITDLLPPGSLDSLTRLVLTNAIYFKAAWSQPFNANETSDAPFTLASGSQVTASTMHQTANFRYMESDGFQVLELPYANGRLAMDILLPTQSGLSGLDSNQIPADMNGWLAGLRGNEVEVSLPKFQMTTQFDLAEPLNALGMTDAFLPYSADFSGITGPASLYIGAAVHKAFISVDETGTEAAAATGIGIMTAAVEFDPNPPVIFNADHPFLFLIRDTQSGSVLFMGQVEDPTQQGSDPSASVITHQPRNQDPDTPNPVVPDPVGQNPVTPPTSPPVTSPPTAPLFGLVFAPRSTAAVLSASEKLVDAYYEALLGRAAESAALAYWSNLLNGGASENSVVAGIESSTEHQQAEIESLYQQYLGRTADQAGLDYFTAELATGGTVEQVAATLAGSQEFLQLHGGTDGAVIDALFTTALGRPADSQSQTYFEQALAAGATRQQVAAQVLNSDEYQQRLAATWLSTLLDRPADPAGIAHFATELRAGIADSQAMEEILTSDEFLAQITSG